MGYTPTLIHTSTKLKSWQALLLQSNACENDEIYNRYSKIDEKHGEITYKHDEIDEKSYASKWDTY